VNQVHNDVQINVYDYMMVQLYVKILDVLQFVLMLMIMKIFRTKLIDLENKEMVRNKGEFEVL
jgi:hypothetical protein